jgi:F0F1-type ATP synthase assembly protein I
LIWDPKNRKYLEYAGLGVEIAASFTIPIILGYYLDERFKTSPWLLLSGIFLGIILLISIFIKIAQDTKEGE